MKGEELLKFDSVRKWIESVDIQSKNRGKTGITYSAKRGRLSKLLEYITTENGNLLNPDKLLEEAQKDIDKAGKRLKDYFDKKIASGVSWNSAGANMATLRGFYTHNGLLFPKKWSLPKSKVSKVTNRDEKTALNDYDSDKGEVVFKNGTLQHFVQNLNFRDQTIALSLLSTGADAADLLKLNMEFVRDGRGRIQNVNRFFWHGNREKTGEEFKTFFSEEATEFLKRYIEQERSDAKDGEPLFAKEDGERLDVHALAMNFRISAKKMGFTKRGMSSPFRPKRFRHWFRTACGIASVEEGYTKAMMGHANEVSHAYLERNKGLFLMEYIKLEPYVTVFGINKTAVTEMSQRMEGLKEKVDEVVLEGHETKVKAAQLEKANAELKETVGVLRSEVEDLREQLSGSTHIIETLEPVLDTFLEFADTPEFEAFKRKKLEKEAELRKEAEKATQRERAEVLKRENDFSKK